MQRPYAMSGGPDKCQCWATNRMLQYLGRALNTGSITGSAAHSTDCSCLVEQYVNKALNAESLGFLREDLPKASS